MKNIEGCLSCAHCILSKDLDKKCNISETLIMTIIMADLSEEHAKELLMAGKHCEEFKQTEFDSSSLIGKSTREIIRKYWNAQQRAETFFGK